MNQIAITEDKMLQLIELYNNACYDLNKASRELSAVKAKADANKEPLAPSIAEYNAYHTLIKKLDADTKQYSEAVNTHQTVMRNAKGELMKNLPANKWLKVGKYYVGRRTNNIPDADDELMAITEKPTTEIIQQIIL